MAHGKETPRQKMIGMMYLVLTAMLALNVSKEAVEAFKRVDAGLTKTIANYVKKNDITYNEFSRAVAENPEKAKKWQDKALEVKQAANDLFNYMQDLKIEIISKAEGTDAEALLPDKQIDVHKIKRIDDTNVPSEVLIGSNEGGKAYALRSAINQYRDFLIETLNGRDKNAEESVLQTLNTDDPRNPENTGTEKWENATFQTLPLVAVITILSKMQVDVRNSETDVLNYLYGQIDAGAMRFNKIVPTIIPNTTYVMQGNDYEARVFVAAIDSTQAPEVYVGNYTPKKNADGTTVYESGGNQPLPTDNSGAGLYKVRATSVGEKSWGGFINIKDPSGAVHSYPFNSKYSVGLPNVVVSPTAMNVLYQGIDNPIDISVPGIGSDKLSARMTNGDIKKGNLKNYRGDWIAQPKVVGEKALITVSASVDGKTQTFPPVEFRVRKIPDPVAKFAGLSEGNLSRSVAAVQQVVSAVLENFEFDLTYTITGFTVSVNDKGFDITEQSTNNKLTGAQKNLIGNLRVGQKLYIEKITAIGPDGRTRNLSPIILKIN